MLFWIPRHSSCSKSKLGISGHLEISNNDIIMQSEYTLWGEVLSVLSWWPTRQRTWEWHHAKAKHIFLLSVFLSFCLSVFISFSFSFLSLESTAFYVCLLRTLPQVVFVSQQNGRSSGAPGSMLWHFLWFFLSLAWLLSCLTISVPFRAESWH